MVMALRRRCGRWGEAGEASHPSSQGGKGWRIRSAEFLAGLLRWGFFALPGKGILRDRNPNGRCVKK
jgi:hypothetical protein